MINGNKYIGIFKQNKFNGKGKIVDKGGKIISEGNFKDGNFIEKKKKDKDKNKNNKDSEEINGENEENKNK